MDGAGFLRQLFYIRIPLPADHGGGRPLRHRLHLHRHGVVYILTRGGPTDATQVLASWAFFRGIDGGDLAQGAAIALFLFPVLVAVAALILRPVRRTEVM